MTKNSAKKKLIEVALPLEAINKESLHRKQKAPKGWPTSFHKWWAQRPLAAARAVIFAQMVDDPSANPDLFPSEKSQDKERRRLFRVIEDLVKWDNTNDERVVQAARNEIWQSWRRACAEYADHPNARDWFDRNRLPTLSDPFAGSGSIPLSAQWLGIESSSSDLNPVAVLINKATIEIPVKFAGRRPVNPRARAEKLLVEREWRGARGLAEDVRYYGQWMHDEAEKRIGHLYPKVEITDEMARNRPDLKPYVGKKLMVIAWLWARTVKSPNPGFANVDVPLASTFVLSTKEGKEAYVEPIVEGDAYHFTVRTGKPKNAETVNGTKLARGANFRCVMSGSPIAPDFIYGEANAGRMGAALMAVVVEGDRGRLYLSPTGAIAAVARQATPTWKPDLAMPDNPRWFSPPLYGLKTYGDLFTPRQVASLTTFSDLVKEARESVLQDALASGLSTDARSLESGGTGATAYADSLAMYLACVLDRMAYYGSSLTTWLPKDNALRDCMPRQALPMTWDFAEGNPLGKSSGDVLTCSNSVSNYLDVATPFANTNVGQFDAQAPADRNKVFVFSTDPPYYDNIGYADLSDYFYVWLRPTLKTFFPNLFSTVEVPKTEELIASPYRHGGQQQAADFFLQGMTTAIHRVAERSHPAFPVTIYYAFKQAESDDNVGTASTGWETFLEAVIQAGLAISGTWPLRTEGAGRMLAKDTNALASSIVLVCRPRTVDAPIATRREFITALKGPTPEEKLVLARELQHPSTLSERRKQIRERLEENLPTALLHLQQSNIAPVDLAQAAIGPGMAVFTRFEKVVDASGQRLSVRDALALINQVLDEVLAEQEGDFDSDTRWAVAWFEQSGFDEGDYGVAEVLARAKNTSVDGMRDGNIVSSGRGKVRLRRPKELPEESDSEHESRVPVWEMVHKLVRTLEAGGESAAAVFVAKLGSKAETARELAYRLFTICERKKRAQEALSYNALVQSWPEITRLAREGGKPETEQAAMFQETTE